MPPRSRRRATASRWPWLIVAGVVFALGIWLGARLAAPPPPPRLDSGPLAPPPSSPPADPSPRVMATEPAPPEPAGSTPTASAAPRIALVIDDLGRSVADVVALEALGVPLTYAVLPFESRTGEVVAAIRQRDAELICHLPMEAKGGADPGPGALLAGMSSAELGAATRRALAAVPGAVGVNNHMGSAISARRASIRAVLDVVAGEGLYYLDSRTTADTLGFAVAGSLGIPAAERQVFLDGDRRPEAIHEQFDRLLGLASSRGSAIAIGHPHAETLAALAEAIPAARRRGYEFVTVGALIAD